MCHYNDTYGVFQCLERTTGQATMLYPRRSKPMSMSVVVYPQPMLLGRWIQGGLGGLRWIMRKWLIQRALRERERGGREACQIGMFILNDCIGPKKVCLQINRQWSLCFFSFYPLSVSQKPEAGPFLVHNNIIKFYSFLNLLTKKE